MKDTLKLAVVLTVIAVVAAGALAYVYDITKGPIAEVKRQAKLAALKQVLPMQFDNSPDQDVVTINAGVDKKGKPIQKTFYLAKQAGKVVGIAFEVVAPDGYAGNITSMVGIDAQGTTQGVVVLDFAETPGLGDKYAQPWFTDKLKGKTAKTDWRPKKDGGEFDTNSGATVTPRALLGSIGRGLKFVDAHREELLK